jgi:alpha-glucosidase
LGDEKEYWRESATSLALMYFMMQGTPFIYQGQEIGMTNVKFEKIEHYDCVGTRNMYAIKREQGVPHEELMEIIWATCRDNSRTPMHWDSTKNAGFTTAAPWLGINDNYTKINVESQLEDEESILNFYKKMIRLRKNSETLIYGKYRLILVNDKQIYAYTRKLGNETYLIMCNLSKDEALYRYKPYKLKHEDLVLCNYSAAEHETTSEILLKPYEARMYKMTK